jgi:hypothetical protein
MTSNQRRNVSMVMLLTLVSIAIWAIAVETPETPKEEAKKQLPNSLSTG